MLEASSTSNDRVLAGITHLCVFVPVWGQIATLVIWLTQKDKSPYVRFHAMQSGAYQVSLLLFGILGMICYFCASMGTLTLVPFFVDTATPNADATSFALMMVTVFLPLLIPILLTIGWLAAVLYGIWGAVNTFQGKPFEYAIIGPRIRKRLEPNRAIY